MVFTSEEADTATIASALERAIAEHLGVQPKVIVLTRAELAQVVADNPSPTSRTPGGSMRSSGTAPCPRRARRRGQPAAAQDQGSDDEARVVGTTMFLHTPAASAAASWQPS